MKRASPAFHKGYKAKADTGDELFPKTFEYASVEGGTRTTERRPLFGDLVDAVQWSRLGV